MEKIELRLDEILKTLNSITQDKGLDVRNTGVRLEAAHDATFGYDVFSWWKWVLVAIIIAVVFYYVVRPYFFPTKKLTVPPKAPSRSTNQTGGENMTPVKSLEELINMKKKTILTKRPPPSAAVVEEMTDAEIQPKDDVSNPTNDSLS